MRVIELDSVGSTNAEAKALAEQAEFGPLWIRADQQTGGRGRNGRKWVSPTGNLYASYLFPTETSISQIGLYSFVAALSVYDCLRKYHPDGEWGLKWPNDVLLGRSKICGMLLETGKTHQQSWVVLGIGINIISHPDDTPYLATSLQEHISKSPDPASMLNELSAAFSYWKSIFEHQGFEPIRTAWRERAINIPGPVSVRLPAETFDGQAIDLRENGALQVRLANGTIRDIHAGDVFLG